MGYSARHFRAFLKQTVRAAGVAGTPVLLALEQHHFEAPGALEDTHSLLACGEVPGLFTAEESGKEVQALADARAAAGLQGTSLWDFFLARVRKACSSAAALALLLPWSARTAHELASALQAACIS